MRRRDHDRIVSAMHSEINYLRRQNDELLNRLMYATDRTWTPPPPQFDGDPDEPVEPYAFAPEQQFDASLPE